LDNKTAMAKVALLLVVVQVTITLVVLMAVVVVSYLSTPRPLNWR
jgi:hypothetical protein